MCRNIVVGGYLSSAVGIFVRLHAYCVDGTVRGSTFFSPLCLCSGSSRLVLGVKLGIPFFAFFFLVSYVGEGNFHETWKGCE